jgi:small-conductance mechanosensitive channel
MMMESQALAFTVVAMVLLVSLVVHVALRRWIGQASRRDEAQQTPHVRSAGARPWIAISLRALASPVVLLVWIQGLYVSARLGLAVYDQSGETLWAVALGWTYALALVLGLCWLLARCGRAIETFLVWQASRTHTAWDDLLLPLAGRTARHTLPLLALILGAPALGASPAVEEIVSNATSLGLIGVVAVVAFQVVGIAAELVLRQHRLDVSNNLQARSIHTQVIVLQKVALTIIAIFALASMLMVFDSVRQFGASILASAGIAGIIVGLAAQRSIATLLAGFQIALTQPIRVDDVVIVENEWGRVDEITLTYVVIQIWDHRRLVVPISHFIERPFQNWTRTSADLLGTVFLHVDYSVPLEELRQELSRILTASPLWDGKVNVLQVTDAKERTLEIRALASAADAGRAWDLRCEVREKLLGFLQRQYPEALPRVRASVDTSVTVHQALTPHPAAAR